LKYFWTAWIKNNMQLIIITINKEKKDNKKAKNGLDIGYVVFVKLISI
jgi:hypothetical protein